MPLVDIVSLEPSGKGVGRLDGQVVFVPLTTPGDKVEFEIVENRGSFLNGRLVKLVSPSSVRTNPPCPVFGNCGSCQWQHIEYSSQLKFKRTILEETLRKIGKIEGIEICDPKPSPSIWNYRYTTRLHVSSNGEIGFFKILSHKVTEFEQCHIIHPQINETIKTIRPFLKDSWFNLESIKIAYNEESDKTLLSLGIKDLKPISHIAKLCTQLTDIPIIDVVNVQGFTQIPVATLYYQAGGIKFHAHLESFVQANLIQNRFLVESVINLVRSIKPSIVVDLYCGIGNLTLPIAKLVENIQGIDFHKKSISDAKENAMVNGIDNVKFSQSFVLKEIHKIRNEGSIPDLVIMDPPRSGAKHETKELVKLMPPNIIYISCNPTTLARDLSSFTSGGYSICSITPIDMFPHNFHIESITHLKKV